jgi:two-component system response regulator
MAQEQAEGTATETVEVLLVEDNPGDAELTKRNLAESKYNLNITVVEDGEAAIAYLRKEGKYADTPRPDLILLDLEMPKMGGFEVIDELQADPALHDVEIMVLTTHYGYVSELLQRGLLPSRYGHKPIDVDQFDQVVQQVKFPVEEKPQRRWWWPFGNR